MMAYTRIPVSLLILLSESSNFVWNLWFIGSVAAHISNQVVSFSIVLRLSTSLTTCFIEF